MTDPTAGLSATPELTLPQQRRGLGFAVSILFLFFGLLAGLCAYYALLVLPPARIHAIDGNSQQIALIESRLRVLEDRAPAPVPAAASTPAGTNEDLSRLQTEVGSLSAALATLQGEMKQAKDIAAQARESTQGLIAASIAFIRLDAAARAGRAFTPELAVLRSATAQQAGWQAALAPLDAYAATGAPSLPALQQQWMALSPLVAQAIDKSAAQNWRERLMAALKSLISIHSVNDPAQRELASIDTALATGDTAAALTALTQLPQLPVAAQQPVEDLRHRLEARRAVDAALAALAARFDAEPALDSAP